MHRVLTASFAALTAACGTSTSSQDLLDAGGTDGASGGDAGSFLVGDASGPQGALDASIEEGKVAVKLVTLSCAGDRVTVQAVGTGGFPPYSYKWENGSTSAVRELCPTASSAYSVSVTDTGEAGEFPRPPATAKASVTAQVLACPDAGPVDAASPPPPSDACVGGFVNPSLAGTPQTSVGLTWDVPGWTQCSVNGQYAAYLANAGVNPGKGVTYPAPSSETTYAAFAVQGMYSTSSSDELPVGFGQALCSLPTGSFTVDARWVDPGISGEPDAASDLVVLDVFEGSSVCASLTDNVSTTNVLITQTWSTYCFTLPSGSPVASITFTGFMTTGGTVDPNAVAIILVDHIVPVASCP